MIEITLPEYELKPDPYGCPTCKCATNIVTLESTEAYGFILGGILVRNAKVYECPQCGWGRTPHETFNMLDECVAEYEENAQVEKTIEIFEEWT